MTTTPPAVSDEQIETISAFSAENQGSGMYEHDAIRTLLSALAPPAQKEPT